MTRLQPERISGHLVQLPELLRVTAVALCVEIGLRTTTLPRLADFLGVPLAVDDAGHVRQPSSGQGAEPFVLPSAARRRLRATRTVMSHWPLGDTCLRQALVSGQRIRQLKPHLHVGVAKVGGEVRAHAWLAVGETVIDPMRAAGSYLPLSVPRTGTPP
ncbi:lasso peptide biosynthesis B2 protein [Microlunatus aurantiacus]|uniref:lasso peptide biosynthesis B2 protein n=1 Tax=Microlunatus aurantiacus TaxID=446786 RepID=UPI003CD065FD